MEYWSDGIQFSNSPSVSPRYIASCVKNAYPAIYTLKNSNDVCQVSRQRRYPSTLQLIRRFQGKIIHRLI